MKTVERWFSDRIESHIQVARWGDYGTPVLLFPTAGGDAEEVERQGLVAACSGLLSSGRIKLYSCDSIAGHVMVSEVGSPDYRMRLANAYQECVRHEVVPAIHSDLGGQQLPIIVAGASIGAFNAIAVLCRYPDVFRAAIGMSGTYDLQRFYDGQFNDAFYLASPLHFLPGLEGPLLDQLRQRFAIIAAGEGQWENIGESWRMAKALGAKGIPNRVDPWGPEWDHEWPTWRAMLPQYLEELA
jgi:esterase/lipase superfamily enzyme